MAENLQNLEPFLEPRDEVDRILDEVLCPERLAALHVLAAGRASLMMDAQELFNSYSAYLQANDPYVGGIKSEWIWELPQSALYTHTLPVTTFVRAGVGEEQHPPRQDSSQDELEKLRAENSKLHNRILMLQKEVLSFYDTVQFAAVSVLFFCALSVTTWLTFDVRLLSPLISIIGMIGAPCFMAMAWIGKNELTQKNNQNENNPVLGLK